MNDTLLGVIIGGLIAFLGSIIGVFLQYKIDNFKAKQESRRQAYINSIKWVSRLGTSDMHFIKDTYEVYEKARIGIYLYGSKEITALFKLVDSNSCCEDDIEHFKKRIEKEIGFKL